MKLVLTISCNFGLVAGRNGASLNDTKLRDAAVVHFDSFSNSFPVILFASNTIVYWILTVINSSTESSITIFSSQSNKITITSIISISGLNATKLASPTSLVLDKQLNFKSKQICNLEILLCT